MKIEKILIPGKSLPVSEESEFSTDQLTLRSSFTVDATRADVVPHIEDLKEDDIVEFEFDDKTVWIGDAYTIHEVFPDWKPDRDGSNIYQIPFSISGDTRSGIGDIITKAVRIFTKKAVEKGKEKGLGIAVKALATKLESKLMAGQVGLYQVNKSFDLIDFNGAQTNEPYLLFLHGTASSFKKTFEHINETELWDYIHHTFPDRVVAFQHETLTHNPFHNILKLVKALPQSVHLHIISQSGGGLHAELLSRFCNNDESKRGFTAAELNSLKKSYPKAYFNNEINAVIKEIHDVLKSKQVKIYKFIRIACPASGSLLAAKRLDHFFNVAFNLLGIAAGSSANPIYAAFKNLITGVIDCKNKVDILPGIEVLNPASPFIKALNNRFECITLDMPLTVISGNAKAKLNFKALVVILSKLYFLKYNDLIVNTASMYKGTKRSGFAQYFFDESPDVDHFRYFKNESTRQAILNALKSKDNELTPGFKQIIEGAPELDRNAILKLEMGELFKNTVTGKKPILIVLPGIMGSNLTEEDNLMWINYPRFIAGQLTRLSIHNKKLRASSIVKTSYVKLVEHFGEKYDVVTFAFDWRQQLNEQAKGLNKKINELLAFKQPIKIIAHSMGGVLVRDFIVTHDATWTLLNKSKGFKLLFLGAPLKGSFRIPRVMFGMDDIIDKLNMIDIWHNKTELLDVFSKLPGLLSLLPHNTEAANNFADIATWQTMADAVDESWPIPDIKDLEVFGKYRDQIIHCLSKIDYSNISYIAGKDKFTPAGYRFEKKRNGNELIFQVTGEGDQSVTWASGIPQELINKKAVYYVPVTHGALANDPSIFKGIEEIIEKGSTDLLSKSKPMVRGDEKLFDAPLNFDHDISPEGVENTILGITADETYTQGETPLRVYVVNGDLRFASYPLLAGHFANDGIVSSEKAIDKRLNGALSARHKLNLYPGQINSSDLFLTGENAFKGAIVVGLGDPDKFSSWQLTKTVEQGITKYLLNQSNMLGNKSDKLPITDFGISCLIVGCGFGGLSIESAVRSILQGIANANQIIKNLDSPFVTGGIKFVEFIEQYEDRSLSCFYALNRIETDADRSLNIVLEKKSILPKPGSKQRIPVESTDRWWNRVTVRQDEKESGADVKKLNFSVSTVSAREDQRPLFASAKIMDGLIEDISIKNHWTPAMAKAIFELLIPNEFKEQLKRRGNIQWMLDRDAAAFPWELLQDTTTESLPICVNAGMIRQLITPDSLPHINTVSNDLALVIGDPDLKGFLYQLPGAYKEGNDVAEILTTNQFNTTKILNGSVPEIVQAIFSGEYKIVHLAAHGKFDPAHPNQSGLVIGNNTYLSTNEFSKMSSIPEFVFVNCCHLGRITGENELFFRDRYKLAANIGTQLIENGVRAVIVAGWAVDDSAAMDFTKEFYELMFSGYIFGEATQKARKHIYDKYGHGNNTWGAYQCYGDPFYMLKNTSGKSKPQSVTFVISQEAEMALNNLKNELKMGGAPDEYINRLKEISTAIDQANIRNPYITELEALLYANLYKYDLAIEKFESVLSMSNASYTVRSLEQYCNIRAKKYMLDFMRGTGVKAEYIAKLDKVIEDLNNLFKISATYERHCLLASTYKRKSFICDEVEDKLTALKKCTEFYQKANEISGKSNESYALTNWFAITGILGLVDIKPNPAKKGVISLKEMKERLNKLKAEVELSLLHNEEYWDMVAIANIELCNYILSGLEQNAMMDSSALLDSYDRLWKFVGSAGEKQAELEHLDILAAALSIGKQNPNAKLLAEAVLKLKQELAAKLN